MHIRVAVALLAGSTLLASACGGGGGGGTETPSGLTDERCSVELTGAMEDRLICLETSEPVVCEGTGAGLPGWYLMIYAMWDEVERTQSTTMQVLARFPEEPKVGKEYEAIGGGSTAMTVSSDTDNDGAVDEAWTATSTDATLKWTLAKIGDAAESGTHPGWGDCKLVDGTMHAELPLSASESGGSATDVLKVDVTF